MGCRCAERRPVLAAGVQALRQGDVRTAAQSAHALGRSLGQDARDLARTLAQAARRRG
ncbi:hypothetical protein [Methylobacterium frigidaeris]|uniref:Uncharacterized protein n=1 Tax=Methylobacterium frigidaeris TaxID=2038277 RepID=A0AA37HG34_9HYPH|nr:hypothetical protein [Methylobacterium frigidaeris]GJD65162.1 hypothetical protein MPEAHAMD_5349 [Methylobacterium frigidaeris]